MSITRCCVRFFEKITCNKPQDIVSFVLKDNKKRATNKVTLIIFKVCFGFADPNDFVKGSAKPITSVHHAFILYQLL